TFLGQRVFGRGASLGRRVGGIGEGRLLRQDQGRCRKFAARRGQDVPPPGQPLKGAFKMKARMALVGALALSLPGPALAQPPAPLKMSLDYDGTLSPLNLVPVKVLVVHAESHSTPGGFGANFSMKSEGTVLSPLPLHNALEI